MEEDRAEDAGAGEGRLPRAGPGAGRFARGSGPPGAAPGLDALTTALGRVMDAVHAELVLCTRAGSILHANHRARKRLDVDEGRRSLGEEIRFLCVALHLQIAERAEGEGTEAVSQAERRVTLDGNELHLRAVDLGIPRHGRSPAILVLLEFQDAFSDQELKQLGLTRAEIGIARLVIQGRTNREIAHTLSISVHTVRHHVQHIHHKTGVRSRTQLTKTLRRHENRAVAP
jgi:ATP/maltotriose-dependent transcriptional regulator MalT